jgi:hypothetical protein
MDGVVEDLMKLGIKRWWIVARGRQSRTMVFEEAGVQLWAAVLRCLKI